jgi:ferrous iron transport protein A
MEVLPLCFSSCASKVQVAEIAGGTRMKEKVQSMGIAPGSTLEVIQSGSGPMLIGVNSTRLAIGNGIAAKIMVHPV